MAIPLRVSRPPLPCHRSSPEHSSPLQPRSPRPPLRLTAALTTAPAALRTALPPATSPAAPPRAVRRPTACRSAAEAAGLASFPWENAVPGGGARGGEEEWGRGNAEAVTGDVEADVVIVGAGVVGLCLADALLMSSPDTRVAVIDSAWPCAGATGAGLHLDGASLPGRRDMAASGAQQAAVGGDGGRAGGGPPAPHRLHAGARAHQHRQGLSGWGASIQAWAVDVRWLSACSLHCTLPRLLLLSPFRLFMAGWRVREQSMGWLGMQDRCEVGSMLVPSQPSHTAPLEQHHRALQHAGLSAHLLSPAALRDVEPALQVPAGCSSALLLPSDWQLDARLAMHALLARCRQHAASGRYVELFEESVASFLRAAGGGRVVGVATGQRRVVAAQAVVVATGTWSSGFIAHALLHTAPASATTEQASQPEDSPKEGTSGSLGSSAASSTGGGREQDPVVPHVRPRKGFLLQLKDVPPVLSLRHALMEFDYTANYAAPSAPTASPATPRPSPSPTTTATMQPPSSSPSPPTAISMTATCDHLSHLLIGSSRELAGFSVEPHAPTIAAILRRTAVFLPSLAHLLQQVEDEAIAARVNVVRTGLRPYAPDGRPLIGPVDSLPGVLFALGHEGSGLLMAPGTADMIMAYLGRGTMPVDAHPFLPQGRLLTLQQLQHMHP
ncbi:unnamed protein product [Closterium sp. Naga37s-1]|nr:unnamed protein product [Closterium sp. Naga37s-1]